MAKKIAFTGKKKTHTHTHTKNTKKTRTSICRKRYYSVVYKELVRAAVLVFRCRVHEKISYLTSAPLE